MEFFNVGLKLIRSESDTVSKSQREYKLFQLVNTIVLV